MQEFSGLSSFENAFKLFKPTKRERSSVQGHKAAEDGEAVKPTRLPTISNLLLRYKFSSGGRSVA
jgi:hypothetical protein